MKDKKVSFAGLFLGLSLAWNMVMLFVLIYYGSHGNDCPSGFECKKIDTSLCYEEKQIGEWKYFREINERESEGLITYRNGTFLNNGTEIPECKK